MKQLNLIIVLFCTVVACQAQETVYKTGAGAIRGYDPVAYFTESVPLKGKKEYSYEYMGADWHFSSEENLNLFKSDPEKYVPAYGGFCAFGVANGYKVKIEPEAWAIVSGRLYLNYDLDVQKQWNADRNGFIEKADEQWKSLKEK